MLLDLSALPWQHRLALQDSETSKDLSPSPGESSLVEASAKHPEGGDIKRQIHLRKKAARMRAWRLRNPEVMKARNRKWYAENKECISNKARLRYAANPSVKISNNRDYYRRNREKVNAYNKRLVERIKREQPERYAAWLRKTYENAKPGLVEYRRRPEIKARHRVESRRWEAANPEKRRAMNRSWVERNKEKVAADRKARKALPEDRPGVDEFLRKVFSRRFIKCYYCQRRTSTKAVHVDHIVPRSKGGKTKADNLCAACPDCNLSKHAALIPDWQKRRDHSQQILHL